MKLAGGIAVASIAALMLAPAAGAAPTVVTSTMAGTATVPTGGNESLRLACPGRAVAVSGAAVRLPSDVHLTDSVPGRGARRWIFRFAATAGAPNREVSALLRCVTLRVPRGLKGVTLGVAGRFEPDVAVSGGSTAREELSCPRGYVPTGYGIGTSDTALSPAAVVPTRSGWAFTIENHGAAEGFATPRIRCLRRSVSGRDDGTTRRLRFEIERVQTGSSVPTGAGGELSDSCARDRFSLATGVSLDPASALRLTGSYPLGTRGGRWSFDNPGPAAPADTTLLCLARNSRFR